MSASRRRGDPRLLESSPEQRQRYELSPFGVHWPEIDEDLSI